MVDYALLDEMQPNDMRRRIRELMAIPERDRTDDEWDELNELEIRTAPGNRDSIRSNDFQQNANNKKKRTNNYPNQVRRSDNRPDNKNFVKPDNQRGPRVTHAQPAETEQNAEGGTKEQRPQRRQHRRPKRYNAEGKPSTPDAVQGATEHSGGGSAEVASIKQQETSSSVKSESSES